MNKSRTPRVLLVVGHSKHSKGATNKKYGISEFDFNEKLALAIKYHSIQLGQTSNLYEVDIFYREEGYAQLPHSINLEEADLVISLHSNAYDTKVSGFETLYYHKKETDKNVALIFQSHFQELFTTNNRGIKAKTSEDRGGYLLKMVQSPIVLVEPFFIDNDKDLESAMEKLKNGSFATMFNRAIYDYFKFFNYEGFDKENV